MNSELETAVETFEQSFKDWFKDHISDGKVHPDLILMFWNCWKASWIEAVKTYRDLLLATGKFEEKKLD